MRMFFAGAENEGVRAVLKECGVKRVLLSYYYIRNRKTKIEDVVADFPEVVIDSGAYTMLAANEEKEADNDSFVREYVDYLKQHVGKFFWVANYDIDGIVGSGVVRRWNEELFEPLEKMGQRVCYVAHDEDNPMFKNASFYFKKYDYVGFSALAARDRYKVKFIEHVYRLARATGKMVHGFGVTDFVTESRFPSFTVDSTTYLGGQRYGSTYYFNGAFFVTIDFRHKHFRKKMGHFCELWGINHERFVADKSDEVLKFNIHMWIENEKNYNRKTLERQWWLTQEEKDRYRQERYFSGGQPTFERRDLRRGRNRRV